MIRFATVLLACVGAVASTLSQAEERQAPCTGLVSSTRPFIQPAALGVGQVGLTFIGHATFVIESPGGIRIATDYNDYLRPPGRLDAVTMNHAHSTHFTDRPDPSIPLVLRGWDVNGGAARHDVVVGDVHIRNVPTSIRDWSGGTERDGNSIFVFETGGLCVAHLGHLHHTLLPGHLKNLGRIDVVLVPVDGGYTLDLEGMIEVLGQLNARVMIPMHYFGSATLARFLDRAGRQWPVERRDDPVLIVSRETLPETPTVIVLPGR
ncbi:MBL fold metallo-hydrolase [Alsobacter sp. SYSU BS001988]|jgi:L-ascorbate metabolism protein UlaG (beta-lactamase superfamily)